MKDTGAKEVARLGRQNLQKISAIKVAGKMVREETGGEEKK